MSRKPVAGSSKAVAPKSKTTAPAARVDETLLDGIDAQRVRRVAALAEELGLVELEVQHGESRIRVRRGGDADAQRTRRGCARRCTVASGRQHAAARAHGRHLLSRAGARTAGVRRCR